MLHKHTQVLTNSFLLFVILITSALVEGSGLSSSDTSNPQVVAPNQTDDIKNYNQRFHTSVKNDSQLYADDVLRIKNYFARQRQCTPGTYQFAQHLPSPQGTRFISVTIHGQEAGICVLDQTSSPLEIASANANPLKTIVSKCQYKLSELSLFTDEMAQAFTGEDMSSPDMMSYITSLTPQKMQNMTSLLAITVNNCRSGQKNSP